MEYKYLKLYLLLIIISIFAQLQAQKITSFSPVSGPVGTTVTINGSGFNSTASENIVYFGSVKANVISASASQLTVKVPYGASYQPISVTANKLTGYSIIPFHVTFKPKSSEFSSSSFKKAVFSASVFPGNGILSDLDSDGQLDYIHRDWSLPNIYIYRNAFVGGVLSFDPKIDVGTLSEPYLIVSSDLDGDGMLDLVVSHINRDIIVLKNTSNNGTISFAPLVKVANGGYRFSVADFDIDGKPDIVFYNQQTNEVSVVRNTTASGSITFSTKYSFPASEIPTETFISDLSGDGKPDFITINSSSVSVFPNLSTPGNINVAAPINYLMPAMPLGLASIADLNSDGKTDMFVSVPETTDMRVFKNLMESNSNLSLSSFSSNDLAVGASQYTLSLGDFNGDGKIDVLTIDLENSDLNLLKNQSNLDNINFAPKFTLASVPGYNGLITGDLNNDGTPDMLVADASKSFSVYLNDMGESPGPVITSFSPSSGNTGTIVTITGTDLNDATSVKFGDVEASSFEQISATTITAVVGAGASGDVSITTPNGTIAKSGFTFGATSASHTVISFSPETASSGTSVTISGTNLSGITGVKFGSVEAQSFTVTSSTSITAVVGAGASGSISVVAGAETATKEGFVYIPTPVLTANGPTTFSMGGSVELTTDTDPGFTYVWTLNGAKISGVTGKTFTATQGGKYKVSITSGGVTTVSNEVVLRRTTILPASNFKVTVVHETCRDANNGQIKINAETSLPYILTVQRNGAFHEAAFTDDVTVEDLPAGLYSFCITLQSEPTFKQCFTATITEPDHLLVYTSLNSADKTISLTLGGADNYLINLNGTTLSTSDKIVRLPLKKGENLLKVRSDIGCQGLVEKSIFLSDAILVHPNPFEDILQINSATEHFADAQVEVFDLNGKNVFKKLFEGGGDNLRLELSHLQSGMYILKLSIEKSETYHKIIKK